MLDVSLLYTPADYPMRKGSSGAIAYDLAAAQDVRIEPGRTVMVPTGLRVAIPSDHAMLLFARSSLHKMGNGCYLANSVGVIDPDYRGEILLAIHNPDSHRYNPREGTWGQGPAEIVKDSRIAQFIIIRTCNIFFQPVDKLPETKRGEGGFGSTGF